MLVRALATQQPSALAALPGRVPLERTAGASVMARELPAPHPGVAQLLRLEAPAQEQQSRARAPAPELVSEQPLWMEEGRLLQEHSSLVEHQWLQGHQHQQHSLPP